MKQKHTREQFEPAREFICLKEILYASKQYLPGDIFKVNLKDRRAVTRARQLYQMRKLDHKDIYTQADIRELKAKMAPPVKKEKPKKKEEATPAPENKNEMPEKTEVTENDMDI